MKRLAITPLLAGVAIAVAPGVAHAGVIATWPLATGANDSSGNGHNGAVQNVVFDGNDASFNGSNTRITVPYSAALSPGAADVTTSLEVNTTHQPGTGDLDFDLIRAEPTGKMYKVELFPHGTIKAQAQCIYTGSLAKTTLHAGPSLNDGQWHSIVCHKTASQVTLTVDDVVVGTTNIAIGTINLKKNAVFALGYKPVPGGTDGDFYNGLMRNVSVSIG